MREPRIFLFDEPLSNLDAELRVQMRVEINKLHRRLGATMIFVTHDQVEAMTLADRIVVLRAGVIEQVGTPLELYNHPANLFVAGFIGSPRMNFLAAEVAARRTAANRASAAASGLRLTVPVADGRCAAGDKVTIGVRPEHLRIVDPAQAHARRRGADRRASRRRDVSLCGASLRARRSSSRSRARARAKSGERVGIDFDASAYHRVRCGRAGAAGAAGGRSGRVGPRDSSTWLKRA